MTEETNANHPPRQEIRYNRGLHILAILTAISTFPLIFMGGLVTSHGAGLAVPDWPNSFGYNMFTFPPSQWIGGIWYEHVHRLMGSLVGFLAILVVVWAFLKENRTWVKWLAGGLLLMVIIQGVLGGLRVIWVHLDLAIVHACVGQAFFCMAGLMVAVTSRWWIEHQKEHGRGVSVAGLRLAKLAAIAVVLIYLQLIVGAIMRHYQAGLAIPDFPLHYGSVLPPASEQALDRVNQWRVGDQLEPVSLAQIWLHVAHRVGALIVTIAVLALGIVAIAYYGHQKLLLRPARLLVSMIIIQVALGILTILWRKPADVASAHVAVGALLLFTAFYLGVRAARLHDGVTDRLPQENPSPSPVGRPLAT